MHQPVIDTSGRSTSLPLEGQHLLGFLSAFFQGLPMPCNSIRKAFRRQNLNFRTRLGYALLDDLVAKLSAWMAWSATSNTAGQEIRRQLTAFAAQV